jgi:hypothetical protein
LRRLENPPGVHVSNFGLAEVYASLGEVDQGIAALENAYREHDGLMAEVKTHPLLDPLRRDLRFAELQKKMGLE